ncbi:MAG TPA: DUF4276 family protein [Acetobacteraceae bacterium]|nr:DUF4276 family protein [Acetobacteraceae bacterium]
MIAGALLYIICEGQTEETFTNVVLAPHFLALGTHVTPLLLPNVRGAHARRNKGGWNSYSLARHFINGVMEQHHRNGVWFTTMFDCYALPQDYPRPSEGIPAAPREKVAALEKAMAHDLVSDRLWRFTPHLQLHEFEALVLADIDLLGEEFPERRHALAMLKADIAGLTPEDVNDGSATHPSARIIRRIPEYEGRKDSAGPILAARIGLDRLRECCPHFGAWISELEHHASGLSAQTVG